MIWETGSPPIPPAGPSLCLPSGFPFRLHFQLWLEKGVIQNRRIRGYSMPFPECFLWNFGGFVFLPMINDFQSENTVSSRCQNREPRLQQMGASWTSHAACIESPEWKELWISLCKMSLSKNPSLHLPGVFPPFCSLSPPSKSRNHEINWASQRQDILQSDWTNPHG